MPTKRVQIDIQMTRRPGELGYKTEFIRKTYHLPVKDILVFARARHLKVSPAEVYTARSNDRKKAAAGRAPQLAPPPATTTPALKLIPAKKAPKTVVKFNVFDSPQPERDFLRLVIRLGIVRAKEMTDNARELIRQEFGI